MTTNLTKVRQTNWSPDEKLKIVQLIDKYKNIIENKETDAVTMAQKKEYWIKIAEEFNGHLSTSSPNYRPLEKMQCFWGNIKSHVKKQFAEFKRQQYQTGGGSMQIALNAIDEIVYNIIKPSIEGLRNPYDNDADYEKNTEKDKYSNENKAPTDDPVFEYLLESNSIINWKKGTPAKLKETLSEPLKNITSRSVFFSNDPFEPIPSTSSGERSARKRSCHCSNQSEILQTKKLKLMTMFEERLKKREELDENKKKLVEVQLKAELLKLKLLEKKVEEEDSEDNDFA